MFGAGSEPHGTMVVGRGESKRAAGTLAAPHREKVLRGELGLGTRASRRRVRWGGMFLGAVCRRAVCVCGGSLGGGGSKVGRGAHPRASRSLNHLDNPLNVGVGEEEHVASKGMALHVRRLLRARPLVEGQGELVKGVLSEREGREGL